MQESKKNVWGYLETCVVDASASRLKPDDGERWVQCRASERRALIQKEIPPVGLSHRGPLPAKHPLERLLALPLVLAGGDVPHPEGNPPRRADVDLLADHIADAALRVEAHVVSDVVLEPGGEDDFVLGVLEGDVAVEVGGDVDGDVGALGDDLEEVSGAVVVSWSAL